MRSCRAAASIGSLVAAACLSLSANRAASAADYYEGGYPDFSTLQVETVPLHIGAGQPFVLRVTVRETTHEPDPIGCTAAVYWNGAVQVTKGLLDIHVSSSVCPS